MGAPGWRDGGGGCCVFEIFLSFLYFPPRLGGVQDFNHGIYEIRKKETLKKNFCNWFLFWFFFGILFYFFLLTALQVEIQFALGKGIKIIYINI